MGEGLFRAHPFATNTLRNGLPLLQANNSGSRPGMAALAWHPAIGPYEMLSGHPMTRFAWKNADGPPARLSLLDAWEASQPEMERALGRPRLVYLPGSLSHVSLARQRN